MEVISLGFRTDLELLLLGGSTVEDRDDHLVVRSPHNPTHWWGNFLLLDAVPAPADSAMWLARFTAAFPSAGHVALGFDGTDGGPDELAWFAANGYGIDAAAVMTADSVHEPPWCNADVDCRALRSDEDWAQSVELRMRCNDKDVHEPLSHLVFATAKAKTDRALVGAGHGGWFGAFAGGRLVAQMGLFPAGPGLARFQHLETDPAYRRQGIAGTLVHRVSRYGFDELGAHRLVMVADPDYFAIDLYRAVGFTRTQTQLRIDLPGAPG